MQEHLPLLCETALFKGLAPHQLATLLPQLCPTVKQRGKGAIVMLAGYETTHIGILLQGSAQGIKTTPSGNSVAVISLQEGSIFGDILAMGNQKSPVTITTLQPCRILYLAQAALLAYTGAHHTLLLQNWVGMISQKYFALSERLDLLILKRLRTKLACFFLAQAQRHQSDTFCIAQNRTQLAEYLGCERTALCRELSRMQQQGLLECYKNSFKLLNKPALQQQCGQE